MEVVEEEDVGCLWLCHCVCLVTGMGAGLVHRCTGWSSLCVLRLALVPLHTHANDCLPHLTAGPRGGAAALRTPRHAAAAALHRVRAGGAVPHSHAGTGAGLDAGEEGAERRWKGGGLAGCRRVGGNSSVSASDRLGAA